MYNQWGEARSVDNALFYLQWAKWIVAPALALVAGVLVLLPQIKAVAKVADIVAIGVSFIYVASFTGFAVYAGQLFDYPAWDILFGTAGEGVSAFTAARISFLFALAALVFATLALLIRMGVLKVSDQPSALSRSAFGKFLKTLVDGSLENFISRKVSGLLYLITAVLMIAGAVVIEFLLLTEVLQGNVLSLVLMLVLPAVTLLSLIIVRMAFEAGIALIVIAENTKK
jgi:hypothetical protein